MSQAGEGQARARDESWAQGRGASWWSRPVARFSLFLAPAPPSSTALLLVPGWRDLDLATHSLVEELAPAAVWHPPLGMGLDLLDPNRFFLTSVAAFFLIASGS